MFRSSVDVATSVILIERCVKKSCFEARRMSQNSAILIEMCVNKSCFEARRMSQKLQIMDHTAHTDRTDRTDHTICGMALSVLVLSARRTAILLRQANSCAACACEDQAEVKLFCVGFVSLLFVLLHGLSALACVPFSHRAVALAPFRLHRALPRWFAFGSKAT